MQSIRESASTEDYMLNKFLILAVEVNRRKVKAMRNDEIMTLKLERIKVIDLEMAISALAVTAPVAETTYLDTGIYCSDTQSVVDSEGEEWGYDAELPDGTTVIITFDSQNTDSRYDDVITGLTEIKG